MTEAYAFRNSIPVFMQGLNQMTVEVPSNPMMMNGMEKINTDLLFLVSQY